MGVAVRKRSKFDPIECVARHVDEVIIVFLRCRDLIHEQRVGFSRDFVEEKVVVVVNFVNLYILFNRTNEIDDRSILETRNCSSQSTSMLVTATVSVTATVRVRVMVVRWS